MPRKVTIYRSRVSSPDTAEYVRTKVASTPSAPSEEAVDLDMAISFSFDLATWYDAAWEGDQWSEGTKNYRMAHLLMTDANLPASSSALFVRPTDNPESPIINAGYVTIA